MAIRFGNIENAKKFFDAFEEMRNYVLKMEAKKIREEVGEEASVEKVDKEKETEEKDLVEDIDAGGDKFQALKERMANMAVGDEE
jgi:regulator of replication initiation timing